jgi:hypothetical protein
MKELPAVITADQIAFTTVDGGQNYTIVYAADGLIDTLDPVTIDALQADFLAVSSKHFAPKDDRVVYFDTVSDVQVDEVAAKQEYADEGVAIPIGKDAPVEVAAVVIVELPPI